MQEVNKYTTCKDFCRFMNNYNGNLVVKGMEAYDEDGNLLATLTLAKNEEPVKKVSFIDKIKNIFK